MTAYKGFIVTGSGRTGSHWLEQVIRFVTDYDAVPIREITQDRPFVSHDHEIQNLVGVPQPVRESCLMIFTRRSDLFAQALSLAVARHTDEWFEYSDRAVQPFEIDPDYFETLIMGSREWNDRFDRQVRPCYPRVLDVAFETLSREDPIEDWVASMIGMANHAGHKSWQSNRNRRAYRQLVENYQDLRQRFGKWALT